MTMHPLLSASAPRQTVWIDANHCRVTGVDYDLSHGSGPLTVSGAIPRSCIGARGTVVLRFSTDGLLQSRRSVGINEDTEAARIGIEKVLVRNSMLVER